MEEDDIYRIRMNIRTGAVYRFATTAPTELHKNSGFFWVAPTIQRANANQAKLEDSAQPAQVIEHVNGLREALDEKGLIKDSA